MTPPRTPRDKSLIGDTSGVAALTGPAGYAEFEIDIAGILRQTLPTFFERIPAAPLTDLAVSQLPVGAKGAYVLLHEGNVVYAGKTDTRHGFRDRLGRHSQSVQHRVGLDPNQMAFRAVRIMVFSAFDIEAILITEMRVAKPEALSWNDSGFGPNDPGRRRNGQEPAKFDRWFPIDIDRPLGIPTGKVSIADILRRAKDAVFIYSGTKAIRISWAPPVPSRRWPPLSPPRPATLREARLGPPVTTCRRLDTWLLLASSSRPNLQAR